MAKSYVSIERRHELIELARTQGAMIVTGKGKQTRQEPAYIVGARNDFAQVRSVGGTSIEYAWATVEHILTDGTSVFRG